MNSNCPCVITQKPCSHACTCVNSLMSGACRYCARYGSKEQRLAHAEALIANAAELDTLKSFVRSLNAYAFEEWYGRWHEGKFCIFDGEGEVVVSGVDAYETWKEFVKNENK